MQQVVVNTPPSGPQILKKSEDLFLTHAGRANGEALLED